MSYPNRLTGPDRGGGGCVAERSPSALFVSPFTWPHPHPPKRSEALMAEKSELMAEKSEKE